MRNRSRTRTKLLLGVLLGSWLATAAMPCVMAASACNILMSGCPETASSEVETAVPCEHAALDCAAPESNTPVSALFELPPAPAFIITTLPAGTLAPAFAVPPAVTQPRARPPNNPLYLEHLALLN